MVISDKRETDIIKSFKKRKVATYILWLASAACIAIAVFSLRNPGDSFTGLEPNIELWGFLAGAAVLFAISIYVWRCPACHKFLGITTNIDACRQCKTVFQAGVKKQK